MNHVHTYPMNGVSRSIEVGRILPKFVTPADVRDLKNRIDPYVRGLDAGVADCKGLPVGVRTGWEAFSKAWRGFYDEEDSWLHTAAQMDQAEAYEADVARWQSTIATYKCSPGAPTITPTEPSLDLDDASSRRWQGTIKTVAIAGAIIAVVVSVRAVVR